MSVGKQQLQDALDFGNCHSELETDLDRFIYNFRLAIQYNDVEKDSLKEEISSLKSQLDTTNSKLKMAEERIEEQNRIIHDLQQSCPAKQPKLKGIEEQNRIIHDLQQSCPAKQPKLKRRESLKRKRDDTVMDLEGKVGVFCRVRPLSSDDDASAEFISYPASTDSLGQRIEILRSEHRETFAFDKVFKSEASQEDVFAEISNLVLSALHGSKVCIFAYGETGSGKTFTMMGSQEERGMIPLSLEKIFETMQTPEYQGWKYKIEASVFEIYGNKICDLSTRKRRAKQCTITYDGCGNPCVSGQRVLEIRSFEEIDSLLHRANQSRCVGETKMNEQSSRSHFVFMLQIFGIKEGTEEQVQGVLKLIDLAGSQRLSKTGATGDQLRESEAINDSLTGLGDVITSLAEGNPVHVPFRNNKLTLVLQPSLCWNFKTVMFVNISSHRSSLGQSLDSLRFAEKVARVNLMKEGEGKKRRLGKELKNSSRSHVAFKKGRALNRFG